MLYLLISILLLLSGCISNGPSQNPVPPLDESRIPVVWLNGTGASCAVYGQVFRDLRKRGYQPMCPEQRNTGNGEDCLKFVEIILDQGPTPIGIAGHSQGGGGALVCLSMVEYLWPYNNFAAIAVEPAHGFKFKSGYDYYSRIMSPTFQFWGSQDRLVSRGWVESGYNAMNGEKYILGALGARHVPVPVKWINQSLSFFDWKLKGESEGPFKALGRNGDWLK